MKIHNILCDKCETGLMDVVVTDKESDVDWNFIIHCDYCGYKKTEASFHGLIQVSSTKWADHTDYVADEDDIHFHVYTKKVVGLK